MSPELLTAIVQASPIGGSLIVMVWIFIRHLNKRDARLQELFDSFVSAGVNQTKAVKLIGENCHNFQHELARDHARLMEQANEALRANSAALAVNTRALEANSTVIAQLAGENGKEQE